MSTSLSKSIFTEWYIGIQFMIQNVEHNCNIKEIIKKFLHLELEIMKNDIFFDDNFEYDLIHLFQVPSGKMSRCITFK